MPRNSADLRFFPPNQSNSSCKTRVSFIGLPGAGKSTALKALVSAMNQKSGQYVIASTDDAVIRRMKDPKDPIILQFQQSTQIQINPILFQSDSPTATFIELYGEPKFRELEELFVIDVIHNAPPHVFFDLGGKVPLREGLAARLKASGVLMIYLEVTHETILARLSKDDLWKTRGIYKLAGPGWTQLALQHREERVEKYKMVADIVLDADYKSPDDIASEALAQFEENLTDSSKQTSINDFNKNLLMKVIHDGDAAYEDIMAAMVLARNAKLVAVTVVQGEATPYLGAENMERVLSMIKPQNQIPVAYGVSFPLDHHGKPFPDFIKEEEDTILDNTDVPMVADSKVTEGAVRLLYDTLKNSDEKITIVATGPLTNIAQLISAYPDCIEKIGKIVIMGGAVHVPGNISDLIADTQNELAEWNIYADPKAAQIVFSTPNLPITLVPIDVTRQMPMTESFYSRLQLETTSELKLIRTMLTTLKQKIGENFYTKLQFWDSLAAMIALDPSMAKFETMSIEIDIATAQTSGTAPQQSLAHVSVATHLNNPKVAYDTFLDLMRTDSAKQSSLEENIKPSHYNPTYFQPSRTSLNPDALTYTP